MRESWGLLAGVVIPLFGALASAGCGGEEAHRERNDAGRSEDASSSLRSSAVHVPSALPVARLSGSLEREADLKRARALGRQLPDYGLHAGGAPGGYAATNPAQGFRASFDRTGFSVAKDAEGWSAAFRADAIACGDARIPIASRGGPTPVSGIPNRVTRTRTAGAVAFTEWYENDPAGVEHGFDFPRAPCTGGGAFTVAVEVSGLTPELTTFAPELALRDDAGVVQLHYTDVVAHDAAGTSLPATLAVEGGEIALRIDARGAVYPVTVDPVTWVRRQTIAGPTESDWAYTIAASPAGDTLVVGSLGTAPTDPVNGPFTGAAYVFTRSGSTWSQQQRVVPSPEIDGEEFGFSLAISGDSLIVGAPDSSTGAVYAYVLQNGSWVSQGQLLPNAPSASSDLFGWSVAVGDSSLGRTAIVGAPNANGGNGAAYVFLRGATGTWSQLGSTMNGASLSSFGWAVALSGNVGLIGDVTVTGAVQVIEPSGAVFVPTTSLSDGTDDDNFGAAVAISGSTAVVGASATNGVVGGAYTFTRNANGSWSAAQALDVSADGTQKGLGQRVAVSGNAVLVNAPDTAIGGNTDQGAAHLFIGGPTFSEVAPQLTDTTNTAAAEELFGQGIAISSGTAFASSFATRQVFVYAYGSANGEACSTGTTCLSGFCSDSVCCNAACSGQCDACSVSAGASVNGTCKIVAAGAAGSPACTPQICNGSSASCAGCTADSQCASTQYCGSDGTCKTSKAQGTACNPSSGGDCQTAGCRVCAASTAGCVDGYCCNSGCSGSCDACSVAAGATTNGVCAVLPARSAGSPACAPDVCNGSSASCATCTADSQCGSTQYCGSDGTCKARKSQGATCNASAGGDCKTAGCGVCAASTAGCVDGVCCNTACSGSCDACSVAAGATTNGVCADVSAGSPGSPACAPSVCNGSSPSCAACTTDSQCASTQYCGSDGTCKTSKAQGAACNATPSGDCKTTGCRVCATSTAGCIDGFCCDKACSGQCDACSVAAGATTNGVCGVVKSGSLGSPACSGTVCNGTSAGCSSCTSDAQCPQGSYCASDASCQLRKSQGTACAASDCLVAGCAECATSTAGCVDGYCCDKACSGQCDACSVLAGATSNGVCGPVAAGSPGVASCAPQVCDGTSTSCASCARDTECAANQYCASDGTCKTSKSQSAACNAAAGGDCKAAGCRVCDATTAGCVDGYCCGTLCGGTCQACNVAPNEGTCEPETTTAGCGTGGAPSTGGATGSGGASGGTDAGGVAGTTSTGGATAPDGSLGGTGMTGGATGTGGSATGGSSGSGGASVVDSGKTPPGTVCSTDGTAVIGADHSEQSCTPYVCSDNACKTTCANVDDCAAPNFCDDTGHCVAEAHGNSSGGCGCRVGADGASPKSDGVRIAAGALLALAMVVRRRRRYRPSSSGARA